MEEQSYHTNVLELKAVLLGLNTLCWTMANTHNLVKTYNSTTVTYLKHMGGSKSTSCNRIARDVWLCVENVGG